MTIRVVLVDDHILFREGLRALLGTHGDFEVVGEAGDARQAYNVVEETQPDLVVLDVSLPGIDGFAAARELRRRAPAMRLVFLSMHAGEDHAARALTVGAFGYLLKEQAGEEVLAALRAVLRGETVIAPRLSRTTVDELLGRFKRGSGDTGPLGQLSDREREIFDMLVRGSSNTEIATHLCISVRTVETHRAHIMKKLNLHSMVDLIRFAAMHTLILT